MVYTTTSSQILQRLKINVETEIDTLLEALDDEYMAWAIYDQVISDFGEVRPFINILDVKHDSI